MSSETSYFDEIVKDPYFIDYAALRRNQNTTYPHNERLREFVESQCAKADDFYWTYGGNWYRGWRKINSEQMPFLVHKVNSEWRHGDNFYNDPDIVAAGCSITAGFGLSHTFAWPKVIEHVTAAKVNNISLTGSPISKIVYNVFDHLARVRSPKYIYLLLPELSRCWHFNSDKKSGSAECAIWSYDHADKSYYSGHRENKRKRLQSINGEKYELAIDMAVSNNLLHLESLAMYCEAHNIKLKIFSWDKMTHFSLESQLKFPGYLQIPNHLKMLDSELGTLKSNELLRWSFPAEILKMGASSCCEFQPQSVWQEKMWETALDINPTNPHPHPGFHAQIHLAEIFLQRSIGVEEWSNIKAWHEGTQYEPNC